MKKINCTLIVFIAVIFNNYSQNYPFPHTYTYTSGSIKPNNYTQAQMNAQVENLWDQWKVVYLQNNCPNTPDQYYVKFSDGTDINTSEGLGYGMLLSAYMAGYDDSAKIYYDGLLKFQRTHPSDINGSNYLMAWEQVTGCVNSTADNPDAATDGDMDVAYSLLLADKQWGSSGSINYKDTALKMINDIMSQEINGNIIKLGDWADNTVAGDGYDTRSSDFMGDHFRAYQYFTGNSSWANVIDEMYSIVDTIQTNNSPTTGLLPDFIINCNTTPVPAPAKFLEAATDGDYDYNACRDPWRMGTDYLISGEPRAKTACDKISAWINNKVSGNANNIRSGYTLTGGNVTNNNFDDPAFIGPFGVGAMCNSANQAFVNSVYSYLLTNQYTPMSDAADYFQNTLQLLCALVMSGNYWPPTAMSGFTLTTLAFHGSITVSPVKDPYSAGDIVTLTAVPDSGYVFNSWSGDTTGSINPLSITMNSNKNITANFTSISGQWCTVQTDLFNTGKWKGAKDSRSKIDTTFSIVDGLMTVPWTVAKMSAPNAWDTYVELDGYLSEGYMTGLSNLRITYQSDQPLTLSLIQPGILEDSGACYMISLNTASSLTTITVPVSQFQQPSWSDLTNIPLELDSVKCVSISPNINPTKKAISGNIVISELLLCDVGGATPVNVVNYKTNNSVFILYPNPAKNSINIMMNNLQENVTIEIINVSGEVIYQNVNLNKTIEQVDVSGFAKGIYFVKATQSNGVIVRKLVIN